MQAGLSNSHQEGCALGAVAESFCWDLMWHCHDLIFADFCAF